MAGFTRNSLIICGTPGRDELSRLTSIKLAAQSLKLLTAANPQGASGPSEDHACIDQLLLALQTSAPSRHRRDSIHRSINNKMISLKALSSTPVHSPRSHSNDKELSASYVGIAQSSARAQESLKRPRVTNPLEIISLTLR